MTLFTAMPTLPRARNRLLASPTRTMPALGLGCVKTPWWKHRRLAISAKGPCLVILLCLAAFLCLERLLMRIPAALRLYDRMRVHICDDYARIAASSGWTPMMFVMRVRL